MEKETAGKPVYALGDRFATACLMTAIGGFLDAYTFTQHGGVFASTQTGNLVLFAISIMNGQFTAALQKIVPVGLFCCGILSTHWVEHHLNGTGRNFWRLGVILVEIVIFVAVGFLPTRTPAILITSAIAFTTALQMTAFRSMNGLGYANMFSTGNLQKAMNNLYSTLATRNRAAGEKFGRYGGLVLCFVAGALVSSLTGRWLTTRSIWVVAGILVIFSTVQLRLSLSAEIYLDRNH
ncbi:YoaK family protein [Schleiferilactobacillus harbinensis]|uniref:YoaK family protein n=1 Tax=Schleiferilactobacillus harbinensis TaxID=304207 RepID=UPI00345E6B7D